VLARVLPVVAGLVLLAACSAGSDTGSPPASGQASPGAADRITIVTDVYPSTFAAEQVGGDRVEVVQLTSPGVEPHDLELSPAQIRQIAQADLVAYVPGLIPAVDAAVEQEAADRAVDLTTGITRLSGDGHSDDGGPARPDPHVWMDPRNMAAMGRAVADGLERRGLGSDWASERLDASMASLDEQFRTELASCRVRPLVVSHEAFGYLAAAYGFEQHGISGLSPEAEPSPAKMAEIAALVRDEGVRTIYFEALASPESAKAIAAETGAATAMLDPIEGSTDGLPYDQLMRRNLATLATGQVCR